MKSGMLVVAATVCGMFSVAGTAAAAKDHPAAATDMNKKECRSQPVKASRFTKKVCMTKAEWKQWEKAADDDRRYFEQQRDRKTQSGPG